MARAMPSVSAKVVSDPHEKSSLTLMHLRLEARPEPSRLAGWLSPIVATLAVLVIGFILFSLMGKNPWQALYAFFLKPLSGRNEIAELLLKAGPIMLCSVGLAAGYRANVWNIGAEGQLIMGAIFGGGVALAFYDSESVLVLPAMLVAGLVGGMLWAAIPALLRTRFNANEILVSLMLVYVASLVLSLLVQGAWRDPEGFNFPQSKMFTEHALLPNLVPETRLNVGFLLSLAAIAAGWLFLGKSHAGFQMRVAGLAPAAANYAGISSSRTVWTGMLIGGACAGLAGVGEVAGPIGQLLPVVSPGYGFAAIIVAFVGRLHPIGILFASLLMSLLYLGGESAQMTLALPSSVTGLFQGTLLLFLLAADVFIHYRLRATRAPAARREARLMGQAVELLMLTLAAGTPLVFAALGELVTEKSGVLNLGVEGMMLVGAVVAFIVAASTKSPWLGSLAGMAAGSALSLVFAVVTLTLQANQVASGLALSLFGVGLSAFVGLGYVSVVIEPVHAVDIAGPLGLARRRQAAVRGKPAGLPVARALRGDPVVPVPHARRADTARRRRIAAVGARNRLSGGAHPLPCRAVRWRVRGIGRRVSVDRRTTRRGRRA